MSDFYLDADPANSFETDPTEVVKRAFLAIFHNASRWSVEQMAPYSRTPTNQGWMATLAVRWHEHGNPGVHMATIRVEVFRES